MERKTKMKKCRRLSIWFCSIVMWCFTLPNLYTSGFVWISILLSGSHSKFKWNLCRHGLAIHTQFIKINFILSYIIRLLSSFYKHFRHFALVRAHDEMHIEAFWTIDGVLTSACTSISSKLLFRLSNANAFFHFVLLGVKI